MPTKGPSNRYGNSRGGRQGHSTEHIFYAWAKGFNKNTLDKHYNSHAGDMGIKTKESYAAHAIKFANTVDKTNCVSFVDPKTKATYKYNKSTNEFAVISQSGYVITFYKPSKGQAYYESEKAKHVKGGRKR